MNSSRHHPTKSQSHPIANILKRYPRWKKRRCRKLVTRTDDSPPEFKIVPETLDEIKRIDSRQIKVVSIFGPARGGKSLVGNRLITNGVVDNGFKVGHDMNACATPASRHTTASPPLYHQVWRTCDWDANASHASIHVLLPPPFNRPQQAYNMRHGPYVALQCILLHYGVLLLRDNSTGLLNSYLLNNSKRFLC